jgi:hypothetical protein
VRAELLVCDLADAREQLVERVGQLDLRVDVLVNNAGLGGHALFTQADPASQMQQVRAMNETTVALCSAFMPARSPATPPTAPASPS